MIKIERPNTKEEAKTLAKIIKTNTQNMRYDMTTAEEYMDGVLWSLSDGGNWDFLLKQAEIYLEKAKESQIDLDEQAKFKDCPAALQKALADNYYEQGVTYYRLKKRLEGVRFAVTLARKQ